MRISGVFYGENSGYESVRLIRERRGEPVTQVPEGENAVLHALKRMAVVTDEANRTTTPLLDAVDISIAADDEIARLAEWN
ncbi:tail fiber assembly protein [Pantoea agglomerans]|uniref:tail fiber assembly protein n=1 Tax=Enterobacter agglomerans TaxID=549 RepID=UPI00292A47A6|nr:tail fiber assembly protein [Pantoea agglomerans]